MLLMLGTTTAGKGRSENQRGTPTCLVDLTIAFGAEPLPTWLENSSKKGLQENPQT